MPEMMYRFRWDADLNGGWDDFSPCGLASRNGMDMTFKKDKVWMAISDCLIFTLLAVEQTHATRAVKWFDKMYTCAYHDREDIQKRIKLGTAERDFSQHQPREFMFCYEILERMIKNKGRVPSFLDKE